MRKLFYRQLIEARHEMLSIYESIDLALHDAVHAFMVGDKKLANKAKERARQLEARCANLEAVCYNLIATQGPVASDFRLLQTIIYTNFCLQRMCDKLRRVARSAKLKVASEMEFPPELLSVVDREAHLVYQVMGTAAAVMVTNDLGLLRSLNAQEESAHDIYEEFFRAYNRMASVDLDSDKSYDDFRRIIMVARYLDRCSQYSIDAAARVAFLLTGQRFDQADLVGIDEDELEAMRIPSGEGVLLRPAVDCRYVSSIPAEELPDELKAFIDNPQDEGSDDEEDDF